MKKNIKIIAALSILIAANNNVDAQSWNLNGNAGTNSATNFIGTSDNVGLKIRTNNILRINITSTGKIGLGNFTPVFKLDVKGGSINTDSVYRIGGKTILSVKGNQNVFTGNGCGNANTSGSSNTAVGSGALYSNTEGQNNTASGTDALFTNTTGSFNTASGRTALFSNTTGDINTASGTSSLYSNTEGFGNAAHGTAALNLNTIGNDNTATGSYSLVNNTEGSSNTANGNNTLISNITGSFNTGIGDNANTSAGALTYATAIGADAIVNSIDKVRIGDAGIGIVEGQVAYSWPSDGRFKENVKDDVKGLDFIMKLQTVSYNFNRLKYAQHIRQHLTPEREKKLVQQSQNRSVGFIAQDVEKIIQQTGFTSFDAVHAPTNETDNYSMGYAEFVVPLVKAVQELNDDLKTEVGSLKLENEKLKNENNQLKDDIVEIKALLGLQTKSSGFRLPISDFSFTIIPNPAKETVIIHFSNVPSKQLQLIVADSTGKEVKSIAVSGNETQINTSEFAAGNYTVKLLDGNKLISLQKLFVNK